MVRERNSQSSLAADIHDQYFTPVETAKWCFDYAHSAHGWEFRGTALEPSVGAGAFVMAAQQLGLELQWTTNDLYPNDAFTPDHQIDFRKSDFGEFDYCITNPPFGKANTLARACCKKGCLVSHRNLMILPRGGLRLGFQDAMPRNRQLVIETLLPDETFVTSSGEERSVKTCLLGWEKVDYEIPTQKSQLDLRTELFSYWCSGLEDWDSRYGTCDIQISRWGTMGKIWPEEKKKQSGARMSIHLEKVTREQWLAVHEKVDVTDYEWKSTSNSPAFDVPVWLHRFNTEAVRQGLQEPPC